MLPSFAKTRRQREPSPRRPTGAPRFVPPPRLPACSNGQLKAVGSAQRLMTETPAMSALQGSRTTSLQRVRTSYLRAEEALATSTSPKDVETLEAVVHEKELVEEAAGLIAPGKEIGLHAVYERPGKPPVPLDLFVGPSANDAKPGKLIDLTSGVRRWAYSGASLEEVVNEFQAKNIYPKGQIAVEGPHSTFSPRTINTRGAATDDHSKALADVSQAQTCRRHRRRGCRRCSGRSGHCPRTSSGSQRGDLPGGLGLQPARELWKPDGEVVPLGPPGDDDVTRVLDRVLRQAKRDWADDEYEVLQQEAIQQRLPLADTPPRRSRRLAVADGFSLHADTAVHGHDRQGSRGCAGMAPGDLSRSVAYAAWTTAATSTRPRRESLHRRGPRAAPGGPAATGEVAPDEFPRCLRAQCLPAPSRHPPVQRGGACCDGASGRGASEEEDQAPPRLGHVAPTHLRHRRAALPVRGPAYHSGAALHAQSRRGETHRPRHHLALARAPPATAPPQLAFAV
jgi:hypothetical protein